MLTSWVKGVKVLVNINDVPDQGGPLGHDQLAITIACAGAPVEMPDDGLHPLQEHAVLLRPCHRDDFLLDT